MAAEDPGKPPPLERAFERLLVVVRVALGTLMLSSIAVNFANVIARRVFSSPFAWAEEAMIYIMVWLVFLGAVLVSWDGTHLKMDLLSSSLRGRWRVVVTGLAVAVVLGVGIFVVVHSYPIVMTFWEFGQLSVAAEIPMALPHAAITVGFGLMLLAVLIRLRRNLSGDPGRQPGDPLEGGGGDGDQRGGGEASTDRAGRDPDDTGAR